jgi:S-adenosylmethionine:tRNA ribosyltransferase-isomerase
VALKTSDFDYPLPPELIAQHPSDRRDQSRLLVLRRRDGQMSDHVFAELPSLLWAGDLLVLNDTAVIPARFICRRAGGGRVEGLFLHELSGDRWEAMLRNASRCRRGERLTIEGAEDATVELGMALGQGRYELTVTPAAPALELLGRCGMTPLPPYIRRPATADDPRDRDHYQTVYAARPGAVAAPTAGLHFTDELLKALADKGIRRAALTLHVGVGTFAPVSAAQPAGHRMHAEWYDLPAATAEAVRTARQEGRRVVAVGTTSLRVLETAASGGELTPGSGWTQLYLYPPAEFRMVDALITNFHLPRTTLLMLVAAFCWPGAETGLEMTRTAYAHAVQRRYRFYSYGDAMLIE